MTLREEMNCRHGWRRACLMFQTPPKVQIFFAAFILLAATVYIVYGHKHSRLAHGVRIKGHEPSPDEIFSPHED